MSDALVTDAPIAMRDLLRDTALEVSMLAQGGGVAEIPKLRERCLRLIDDFDQGLEQRFVAPETRNDAVYAQCGLLDEAVLMHLPYNDRGNWDAHPLQVQRFGNHDAGERVYEQLIHHMRAPKPNVDLLMCYAAILGLGFKGKYGLARERERTILITELDSTISEYRSNRADTFIVNEIGRGRFAWLRGLSPWMMAGIICLAALLLYLILESSLDNQVASILSQKI